MGVSYKSWGHRKVGDSVLLMLFNGGLWCGVSPLKCLKYYTPVGELYNVFLHTIPAFV